MVRKVGENIHRIPFTGTLKAFGSGRPFLSIPEPLLRMMGLRVKQKLRAKLTNGGLTLTVPRVSSSIFKVLPRKQSGADRTRFEREWSRAINMLQRNRKVKRRSLL